MDKEAFDNCFSFIKVIDNYIRDIDIDRIEEYQDFFPFIDDADISLYKDTDKSVIIQYTIGIFLNSKLDFENKDNILYIFITSYILSIKYLTDCCLYKPYSFIVDFIDEFELDNIRKLMTDDRYESCMKKMLRIERRILYNIDFFSKNEI